MKWSALKQGLTDPKTNSCEKALFAFVALTFFCLPLGTAPSSIAAGLAAAVWLFSGIALKRRAIYLSSYWWPVFFMILLPWVGLLYSLDNTGISMDYARKSYYWLFGLTAAAISYRHFSVTRLIQAFMLGLGINVLAAIAQMAFHLQGKHNWHLGMGPDYSTLSAYLIVGIMMGLYFLRKQRGNGGKMALAGLIGLYFFHLVALQSRASHVAFVLLVPIMGYTFFETKKVLKTTAVCVLIPALMLISPVVRERVELSVNQLSHHLSADDASAWGKKYSVHQDRFYMWNGALHIIQEHPWIGVGTGGYMNAMKAQESDGNVPTMAHPHNNFLYMTVSYGLIGLGVFLWFLAVTLSNGWRYRHTAQGYMLFSVILVMMTTGLFNSQIIDVGTAFLISLTVGMKPSFENERY